jgi:hypothetical protein
MKITSTVFAVAFGIAAIAAAAPAMQHIGTKYGSRDPHTCTSRAAPAHGAISPALAKQYFTCDAEMESATSGGHTLHLVTGVSVQVGAPRPFLMGSDDTGDNVDRGIDPHYAVYPIRGSFVDWACSEISEFAPAGKNCMRQPMPKATGICFMSSFKEWHCSMVDLSQSGQNGVAPPHGD